MNDSYQVRLEIFEGPLDLLLYLIKKKDMDILDIQVSEITQEYLGYIEIMKDLNLEMAGDFLVMASSLVQIKARMLLPQEPGAPEAEEGPDPRAELVAKLLEYQKFKQVAEVLSKREFEARETYYRNVLPVFAEEDMTLQATLFDLLDAFKGVLNTASDDVKELLYEQIPLEQKIREILDLTEKEPSISFSRIFTPGKSRRELIVTFLALLELIRLKQISARQSESFAEIRIHRLPDAPPVAQDAPPGEAGQ
jgi:segregation and condensation protein A